MDKNENLLQKSAHELHVRLLYTEDMAFKLMLHTVIFYN